MNSGGGFVCVEVMFTTNLAVTPSSLSIPAKWASSPRWGARRGGMRTQRRRTAGSRDNSTVHLWTEKHRRMLLQKRRQLHKDIGKDSPFHKASGSHQ